MSASSRALPAPLIRDRHLDLAAIGLWAVPATLIVYLALENGGYGVVERSEVGIAVWWLVLVGCAVGMFPARRPLAAAALLLLGLLAAFTAWTTLSLGWTESDERTAIEVGRLLAYLGILALALIVQRGERWRAVLAGVVSGIAAVLGLALLSRLQPNWFPTQVAHEYLPGAQLERRLAYPLNYSTALATLAAVAIPLLLAVAGSARRIALQAGAAAAVTVAARGPLADRIVTARPAGADRDRLVPDPRRPTGSRRSARRSSRSAAPRSRSRRSSSARRSTPARPARRRSRRATR